MGVAAKSEFVYQNRVKLIQSGRTHKHICALKSLSIEKTCSITNFLATSLTTCYEVKNKNTFKVKWMKMKKIFSPQMSASWCDLLNEDVNKLTRTKHFLWQKFLLRDVWVYDLSVTHKDHLLYFCFMESYWLFTDFQVISHNPIWVLLIWATMSFPEVVRPK